METKSVPVRSCAAQPLTLISASTPRTHKWWLDTSLARDNCFVEHGDGADRASHWSEYLWAMFILYWSRSKHTSNILKIVLERLYFRLSGSQFSLLFIHFRWSQNLSSWELERVGRLGSGYVPRCRRLSKKIPVWTVLIPPSTLDQGIIS